MTESLRLALASIIALAAGACAAGVDGTRALRNFIQPPATLDAQAETSFQTGRALFGKRWTEAEGLGPLFDGQSCLICHPRGGNGRPVEPGRTNAENASMILRFVEGGGAYGHQLQRRSTDAAGEGTFSVAWTETGFRFSDGETVLLRAPRYTLSGGRFGAFPTAYSVRIAPKIAGTGLLGLVPESEIRLGADPEDHDGDGISGRIALTAEGALGRFGWRGETASIPQQVARALALDMGLSTTIYPDPRGDCPAGTCLTNTASIEVSERQFADLVRFVLMIEPPPQAARNAEAKRGEALFSAIGCARCHRPDLATESGRAIHPFTDLLLHDLGQGLADGGGSEWRTAPLWGLTLRRQVHGEEYYLHDGRARSLTEAILWHGGEAAAARSAFAGLSRARRRALLAFLETI